MLYPIFYLKNIDSCIFTPKTPLVKEHYFLTLWNFTYLKDTSFGKKLCNYEHGLETKNEFEKWPLITFFQCIICMNRENTINTCLKNEDKISEVIIKQKDFRYYIKKDLTYLDGQVFYKKKV